MAIDREIIVGLNKKSESNSTIAKELQIRCETVWKVVKKGDRSDIQSAGPWQKENSLNQANG